MYKRSLLPMDSYRLAEFVAPLSCFVCDAGNSHAAECCRYCGAPMALALQASAQKVQPVCIAVVGSSGSGKTSYLGMLADMLSRKNDRLQMLARGAFSIGMVQSTIGALRQCRFPDPTSQEPHEWNWLLCQVSHPGSKRTTELILPDVSGMAVSHEIDHPRSVPSVRAFLSRCVAAMIFIDAAEVEEGQHVQDFFAMKMINYLLDLNDHRRHGWPRRPVALVYTKADRCEPCYADPVAFTQKHVSNLRKQCDDRLQRHRFFATSVAGASAYHREVSGRIEVPLRVEPRGLIEPFEWLITQLA